MKLFEGNKYALYREKNILHWLVNLRKVANWLIVFSSFLFILITIYLIGFPSVESVKIAIEKSLRVLPYIFMIAWAVRFIAGRLSGDKRKIRGAMFVYLFLYAMLLPILFPNLGGYNLEPVWRPVCKVLESKYYIAIVLGFVSIIEISNAVAGLLNRKTNPARILAISFLTVIIVGTGLLLLPKATHDGISIINALFISTSATCVTGLTPLDVSATFTVLGQTLICILIQIGGLGIMTMTSFFAMFFMNNGSIYNYMVVSSLINSEKISSLLSALLKILIVTAIVELLGSAFIWASIHGTLGITIGQEIFFSVFHSVSAFCNAGFSTLSNNLAQNSVAGNNGLYLSISLLIIIGGIGFPILSNFLNSSGYYIKNVIKRIFNRNHRIRKRVHLLSLNSKIVIITTSLLLIGGTLLMMLYQWNYLSGGIWDRIVQSFFLAVTPRTAGFNSIPMQTYSLQAILLTMLLMWIGGASQSTAGGVKVNAFAVAAINLWSVIRGKNKSEVLGRELRQDSINTANATILASVLVLIISIFILTLLEPDIPFLNLAFEAISAIGTVGLSLDTTPLLCEGSKIVLIVLMFTGRIGVITLMLGIIKKHKENNFDYPTDNIIIT